MPRRFWTGAPEQRLIADQVLVDVRASFGTLVEILGEEMAARKADFESVEEARVVLKDTANGSRDAREAASAS